MPNVDYSHNLEKLVDGFDSAEEHQDGIELFKVTSESGSNLHYWVTGKFHVSVNHGIATVTTASELSTDNIHPTVHWLTIAMLKAGFRPTSQPAIYPTGSEEAGREEGRQMYFVSCRVTAQFIRKDPADTELDLA